MTDTNNRKIRKHRVLSVIGLTVAGILFALAVFVFAVTAHAKRSNRIPVFFGYSFSIVMTPSMEPDIMVGELLIVKTFDIEDVEEGDVVVFTGLSGNIAGERIVHRVVEKGTDEDGVYLITQGVNNPVPDADKVRRSNFVGISAGHSLFLGKAVTFLFRAESILFILLLAILTVIMVKQIKGIAAAVKEDKDEITDKADNSDDGIKPLQNAEAESEEP